MFGYKWACIIIIIIHVYSAYYYPFVLKTIYYHYCTCMSCIIAFLPLVSHKRAVVSAA